MVTKIYRNNVTNKVMLSGKLVSDFEFDHYAHSHSFYKTIIAVKRSSGNIDYIPLTVSDKLIDVDRNYCGENILITGEFRSLNRHIDNKTKLELSVRVKTLEIIDDDCRSTNINNMIILNGYICKTPSYRKTPITDIDITDIMIAVNRNKKGTDYIPCICWHNEAKFSSSLKTGDNIKIYGRIQSREYLKKLNETDAETRVAYEVSIGKLELIK